MITEGESTTNGLVTALQRVLEWQQFYYSNDEMLLALTQVMQWLLLRQQPTHNSG